MKSANHWQLKNFHQLPFATGNHVWETFEPVACGDFWLSALPTAKQPSLIDLDSPL